MTPPLKQHAVEGEAVGVQMPPVPLSFRLVAGVRPNGEAAWIVHTAVRPEPGMEIQFTAEPVDARPQRRRREKP
jgi:hypothetical protein